ncbi:hypothetical protein L6452_03780 [Arctium lappa]|uniref:Uncharacterized protein n=1 Tax=Arctium lappa TaxID=4217 RepID=A0ACB9FN69_ARCLA|nr:hypothetical protein L6452_03780 [Arctium lappa]
MLTMKIDLPLLDRNTRFPFWKIKMRDVLIQMGLHWCIEGRDAMPDAWNEELKDYNDLRALSQFRLHLSNDVLQDVCDDTTTAGMWARLENLLMTKSLPNKLHMKQRLYTHRLQEGGSIIEHISTFKEIVEDLKSLDVSYDEEDLGLILLCLLPPSFANFMDTIINIRDSLSLEENKNKDKGNGSSSQSHADVAEDDTGDLMVVTDDVKASPPEWILDSGCTYHMCPNRDWFSTYEPCSGSVRVGNGALCKIVDQGNVRIKMYDGVIRTLGNVRHVPELKRNLISLSSLDIKGYKFIGEGGVIKVVRGNLVYLKGTRQSAHLYVLTGTTIMGDAQVASSTLSSVDKNKVVAYETRTYE